MKAPCLFCADADAVVRMSLDDDPEFTCSECDATFTVAEVRERIEAWAAVLKWVEAGPFRCERPAGELKLA